MISSNPDKNLNRFGLTVLLCAVMSYGCARVEVQAPKDPIKMDISMRLDVYQHVVKDIDEIEALVSGGSQHAWAQFLITTAYAGDMDPAIENAALRRRDRRASLVSALASGSLGEGRSGLVVVRSSDPSAAALADAENADRMTIYQALASREDVAVSEIQKVYADRLRKDAPAGASVEGADGQWTTR